MTAAGCCRPLVLRTVLHCLCFLPSMVDIQNAFAVCLGDGRLRSRLRLSARGFLTLLHVHGMTGVRRALTHHTKHVRATALPPHAPQRSGCSPMPHGSKSEFNHDLLILLVTFQFSRALHAVKRRLVMLYQDRWSHHGASLSLHPHLPHLPRRPVSRRA
jgi:hypothetical protein